MKQTDKIFAGLILLSMALFWVIMSPAAFTSRVSEAAPVSLTQPQTPAAKEAPRKRQQAQFGPEERKRQVRRTKVPPLPPLQPHIITLEDGTTVGILPQHN